MHLNPGITSCWTPSGEQSKVESAGSDERYQIFGCVDYRSGDLLISEQDRKRSAEFVLHIEQILLRWPDRPIVLICDNFQVHKTKAIKELERAHFGRLLLVYLPTYSPHLNPIEMLWRHIRRLVTHNYRFATLADVKEAVRAAFLLLSCPAVLSIIGSEPLKRAEAT